VAELGEAVLRITADPREALAALEKVRDALGRGTGGNFDNLFNGLEQSARQAGTQAGRALKQSLEAASKTQKLKFANFTEALEFNPKNTVKGLNEYITALRELRDGSELSERSTQLLTDRIGALEAALGRAKQTTAQASEVQRQFNEALNKAQIKRAAEQARDLAAATEDTAEAQKTSINSINSVGRAVQQTTGFIEQQISAYRALGAIAGKGIGDIRGTAKVGGNLVKGAVSAGRGLYNLGAEFGVFEEPKTGPIKQAIAQVAERFKFLGEQAKTTRGFLLRTFEGGAVGTGVAALAQQLPEITKYLNDLKAASVATSSSFDWLAKVAQAFDRFVPDGPSGGLLGLFAKLGNVAATSASGVTSLADSAVQLGSNLITGPLAGIRELTDVLGQIPPEAQVAVLALAGLSAGVSSEQTVNSINKILDALGDVELQSLEVNTALDRILSKELQSSGLTSQERDQKRRNADSLRERRQAILNARAVEERLRNAPLALPSTELLAQRVGTGIAPERLTPGISNVSASQAVAALKAQVAEAQKLAASERQAQGEQTQLNAALEAGLQVMQTMVGVIDEQVQGYKFEKEQLADIIAEQQKLVALEAQRSAEARKRTAAEAKDRRQRQQAADERRQEIRARGTEDRIQRVLDRKQAEKDLNRRLGDAQGSALIGGAFPLLFGQGLGASIGGGLGGAAGGLLGGQFGFGLSLVGTAIGQLFDTLAQRSKDLAKALQDPIKNLETLRSAFVFASAAQESYVQALLDSGQTAKAEEVVRGETARTIEPAAANLLYGSTEKLNRSWSDLSDRLGGFVSGPAAAFNNWLSELIRLTGGVPGKPLPVTGPEAKKNAGDRSLRGGGLLSLGLGLGATALALGGAAAAAVPSGGLSLAAIPGILSLGAGATAAGVGSAAAIGSGLGEVDTAEKLRKISIDPQVRVAEESLASITKKRLDVERQIVQAKLQGKAAVAGQLEIEGQLLAINADFARKASAIEQERAAGNITSQEATDQQNQLVEATRAQKVQIAAQGAAAAREARQQLKYARELVGVYGTQRRILEERQKIDEAQRTNNDAQAVFRAQQARGASPEDLAIYQKAAERAQADLNRIRLEGEENIRRLEAERWANAFAAANKIKSIQEQTKIESLGINIGGTGRAVLEQLKARRDAQRAVQEAQANLAAAPTDEGLQQQAQQANESLKLASETTKNNLIAAYNAAKDSVRAISRSLQDGVLALAQLQNTSGQGINKFLSPQDVQQRQEALNPGLLRRAQEAVNTFNSRTGIPVDINVTGTTEQRNAQLIDIAKTFGEENRAVEDLVEVNKSMVVATNELTLATAGLTAANISIAQTVPVLIQSLNALVGKDWSVNVSVPTKNYNTPLPGF
jgi:hypothetical protein